MFTPWCQNSLVVHCGWAAQPDGDVESLSRAAWPALRRLPGVWVVRPAGPALSGRRGARLALFKTAICLAGAICGAGWGVLAGGGEWGRRRRAVHRRLVAGRGKRCLGGLLGARAGRDGRFDGPFFWHRAGGWGDLFVLDAARPACGAAAGLWRANWRFYAGGRVVLAAMARGRTTPGDAHRATQLSGQPLWL